MPAQNKVLIANMLAAYGRTVLVAGLTLLSSRWILAGLGQVDYSRCRILALCALLGFVIERNTGVVRSWLRGQLTGEAA